MIAAAPAERVRLGGGGGGCGGVACQDCALALAFL